MRKGRKRISPVRERRRGHLCPLKSRSSSWKELKNGIDIRRAYGRIGRTRANQPAAPTLKDSTAWRPYPLNSLLIPSVTTALSRSPRPLLRTSPSRFAASRLPPSVLPRPSCHRERGRRQRLSSKSCLPPSLPPSLALATSSHRRGARRWWLPAR
jgi:hypothetical protein